MTDANRKVNAGIELAFVPRFLQAAEVLAQAGLYDRATAQIYYALYHAVCALLLTEGLEPRSHRAAQQLLSLHFVRPGHLAKEHLQTLAELQREREEADYIASYPNDAQAYDELRRGVEKALAAIRLLLRSRGVATS